MTSKFGGRKYTSRYSRRGKASSAKKEREERDMCKEKRDEIKAEDILAKIERGEDVKFKDAIVTGDLNLSKHIERDDRELESSPKQVKSDINIKNSIICGSINWSNVTFQKPVNVENSIFNRNVDFTNSKFNKKTKFIQVQFKKDTYFKGVEFGIEASSQFARFEDDANYKNSTFCGVANFENSIFNRNVDFKNSKFKKQTNFYQVQFKKDAYFKGTEFGRCLLNEIYMISYQSNEKSKFGNNNLGVTQLDVSMLAASKK